MSSTDNENGGFSIIKHQKILITAKTPSFFFDLSVIKNNIYSFTSLFPDFSMYYSVKTNPMPEILKECNGQNLNFDAATIGEINKLTNMNINPSHILFTHPVKLPETIQGAVRLGVNKFTFDSLEELIDLAKYARDKKYFLRIRPISEGSLYKYSDKFGASQQDIAAILEYACKELISIHGISFMIGSQTMTLDPWIKTLQYARAIIQDWYEKIPTLRVVNIGSGFPLQYTFAQCITLKEIAHTVNEIKKTFPNDISFWAEPGRIIVGNAGILVCTVIKNIQRTNHRWLFVDFGVYHGFIEILESRGRLIYPISSFNNGETVSYHVGGATLDPDDTLAMDVQLPKSLKAGDIVIFHDIGAYTTSFFSEYHSLEKPNIHFLE